MNIVNLPEHFDNVAALLGPDELRRLLQDELSPEFYEAWYRRFATQTNADGSPWSSDLIDTGELFASINVTIVDTSIEAGPDGDRNIDVAEQQAALGNYVGGIDEILHEQIATALDNWMGRAFEERF